MNTSRTIKMFVLVAVLLVVTIVPAVIQGNFAHRWGDPPDLIAAAERLNQVPEQFGDWVKESSGRPMSDVEKEILHCYAHNNNSYRNKTTGQRVDIIMTVGPAGPIVRHNPEFCYECRNAVHVGESSMIKVETPEQGEKRLPNSALQIARRDGERIRNRLCLERRRPLESADVSADRLRRRSGDLWLATIWRRDDPGRVQGGVRVVPERVFARNPSHGADADRAQSNRGSIVHRSAAPFGRRFIGPPADRYARSP